MKNVRRRRDLQRILLEGRAENQRQIVERLKDLGHDVTQATVSRDLSDIGATKLRVGGRAAYTMPDETGARPKGYGMTRELERVLSEFVLDVRGAASVVVLRTTPGHAPAVARAIDIASPEKVAGTIAGDDTVFVATGSELAATSVASEWGSLMRVTS